MCQFISQTASRQVSGRKSRTPIKGGRDTFYLVLLEQGKELSSTPNAAETAQELCRGQGMKSYREEHRGEGDYCQTGPAGPC